MAYCLKMAEAATPDDCAAVERSQWYSGPHQSRPEVAADDSIYSASKHDIESGELIALLAAYCFDETLVAQLRLTAPSIPLFGKS